MLISGDFITLLLRHMAYEQYFPGGQNLARHNAFHYRPRHQTCIIADASRQSTNGDTKLRMQNAATGLFRAGVPASEVNQDSVSTIYVTKARNPQPHSETLI